jgi:hypothetical protein
VPLRAPRVAGPSGLQAGGEEHELLSQQQQGLAQVGALQGWDGGGSGLSYRASST